jgi:hypothetical protein
MNCDFEVLEWTKIGMGAWFVVEFVSTWDRIEFSLPDETSWA